MVPRVVPAVLLALIATLPVAATELAAQSRSDSAAYRSVTQTPLGALPAALDFAITGENPGAPSFAVSYGLMSFDDYEYIHNIGVHTSFALGRRLALGLTAGYWYPDCNGECSGHAMADVSISQGMARVRIGDGTWSHLNVALRLESGVAFPSGETLWAGRATLPLSLVPGGTGSPRFTPYLSPGVAVGLERGDETEAGITATLGGGVGVLDLLGVRLNVGVERAYLRRGGNWLVGLGVATRR